MSQSPLVIWRLTDGKPGHMQQTLGLVRALQARMPCEVIDMDMVATPVGVRDLLLGRFMPGVAKKRPNLIIGAGHRTHLGLLAARKFAGGKAIVLMKPSLPAFLFDLVIAPEHDGLAASERVMLTRGVLNPMRPAEKKPDSLLLLIGGPSKHVQWSNEAILEQVAAVVASLKPGSNWRITDSRRTPDELRQRLRVLYGERFISFDDCPPGWLAERLAVTETVWVSEDSVSMVYEALTAGCHTGLLRLPAAAAPGRVMKGVEALLADGKAIAFGDWARGASLAASASFNEADRIVALLLSSLSLTSSGNAEKD